MVASVCSPACADKTPETPLSLSITFFYLFAVLFALHVPGIFNTPCQIINEVIYKVPLHFQRFTWNRYKLKQF